MTDEVRRCPIADKPDRQCILHRSISRFGTGAVRRWYARRSCQKEIDVADTDASAVELATELTIAWLGNSNTRVAADDVPAFLRAMVDTVTSLQGGSSNGVATQEAPADYTPAVSVRKSLASKDHIISMIDGKPYKTLRRHLATNGLTPPEYRERYGLKADYPMVAENYSESRRAMAKKIGLGRKPGQKAGEPAPARKPRKAAEPTAE